MRIAVDYDDTYTRDKGLFNYFIGQAIVTGHEVKFITARFEEMDNRDIIADAYELGIDIVFCNSNQKEECWDANIWIDDAPESIPTYNKLHLA